MYIKRFKTGKVSHYLRPVQLITGRWAIETKIYNKSDFVVNMNYPVFDTFEDADKYLNSQMFERCG